MVDLMDTLGLDKVEDPDNLPDGAYQGIIKDCGYVKSKTDKLGLVVIYKVDDPQSSYHGREKYDWTNIGEGNVHEEEDDWKFDRPIMSENQKPYFNKRMEQLGIPKSALSNLKQEHLKSRVGLRCNFKIKNKDGYNNVVEVQLTSNTPVAVGEDNPFQSSTPTPTSTTTPSAGTNLANDI